MRFQFNVIDNRRRSQEEHLAILRALREKDLQGAERLLSRHVSTAGEQLVDFLGAHLNAQP
jgi:DNA-binding GntR family transcriptional regulator